MPFRVPTRARSRSHVKWLQRCLSCPSSSHGRCKVTVDEQRSPTLASRARPRGLTWPAASVMLKVRRPALFAVSHWSSGSTSRLLVDSVHTSLGKMHRAHTPEGARWTAGTSSARSRHSAGKSPPETRRPTERWRADAAIAMLKFEAGRRAQVRLSRRSGFWGSQGGPPAPRPAPGLYS